jgi:hypothetical protein
MRLLIGCLLLAASPCGAQHREAMLPAPDVAAILASEQYCRYRYDTTQIERYLALHPASAETGFGERLAGMERDYTTAFEGYSWSEKVAHCGWIRTIAEEGGFLK